MNITRRKLAGCFLKFASVSTADTLDNAVCPLCGATFNCNPADCWCSRLPHILPVDDLAGCYCPQCFDKIIREKMTKEEPI